MMSCRHLFISARYVFILITPSLLSQTQAIALTLKLWVSNYHCWNDHETDPSPELQQGSSKSSILRM